jgi:hypothetical protein
LCLHYQLRCGLRYMGVCARVFLGVGACLARHAGCVFVLASRGALMLQHERASQCSRCPPQLRQWPPLGGSRALCHVPRAPCPVLPNPPPLQAVLLRNRRRWDAGWSDVGTPEPYPGPDGSQEALPCCMLTAFGKSMAVDIRDGSVVGSARCAPGDAEYCCPELRAHGMC